MIKGSCLCAEIEFEAEEIQGMTFNCHCSRCRKSHGSVYSTQVLSKKNSLIFTKGKDLLTEFESTGAIRTFCSKCGSRLMNYGKEGMDYLSISISAINAPSNFKPMGECFTPEKLDFVKLDNSIAHFEKFP